jgi:hypothetical protein
VAAEFPSIDAQQVVDAALEPCRVKGAMTRGYRLLGRPQPDQSDLNLVLTAVA